MEETTKPLIFNKAVLTTLKRANASPLVLRSIANRQNHPIRTWEAYSQYLILMHNWAGAIHCRPDQLVEFLRIRGAGRAE